MKYCEEYAALLDLFVDGELSVEEMDRVQAHLEVCPGCQAYVDDALAIRAAFPEAEDEDVPEGFAESVMERVRRDAGKDDKVIQLRRRSFRRWMGTLAAAAACCALVISLRGGSLFNGMNAPTASGGGMDSAPADTDSAAPEDGASGNLEAAAPRFAPESAEAAIEEPKEEPYAAATAGPEEGLQAYSNRAAEDAGDIVCGLPAAPAPEENAATEDLEQDQNAVESQKSQAVLHFTAEEVGDLLDGFVPVKDSGPERSYELSAEECRDLLAALGRSDEAPEEGLVLVVVTASD